MTDEAISSVAEATDCTNAFEGVEMGKERGGPGVGDPVRLAPVIARQRFYQAHKFQSVQGPVGSARPEQDARKPLHVLDQGVAVFRPLRQAREDQD